MTKSIYVRLLGEGTEVYRPIPATKVAERIYVIQNDASYDPDDETWEFTPGSRVVVEERQSVGEMQLVATKLDV